jgi:hypothetical protein
MVYVLDADARERMVPRAARDLRAVDGVDLVAHGVNGEAAIWSPRGELRFAPGGDLEDPRGRRWSVEGEPRTLWLSLEDARIEESDYPDALARLWSALECRYGGDLLVSAQEGYEFVDWGGADHVGGGSHGSLDRDDSEGVLLMCGLDVPEREHWSLADVTPLVLEHFSVSS